MARRVKGADATIEISPDDQGLLKLAQQWTSKIEEASGSMDEIAESTSTMAGSWKGTVTGINQALEIAQKFGSAVSAGVDMLRDAAANDAVDKAFARRIGNAQKALEAMREASAGTLSDQALKGIATEFDRANVSIEDTAKVLNVAAKISAETGQEMADVTEALRDSIIGASDSDLEKFGIIFDMPAEVQKFAEETGLAADEIDKAVESQVVLKHITGEVAKEFANVELSGSLVTKVDQLTARMEALKSKASKTFTEAAVGFAMEMGWVDTQVTTTAGAVAAMGKEIDAALSKAAFGTNAARESLSDYADSARTAAAMNRERGRSLDELSSSTSKAYTSFGLLLEEAKTSGDAMARLDDIVLKLAKQQLPHLADAGSDAVIWNTELNKVMVQLHTELGTGKEVVGFYADVVRDQLAGHFDAATSAGEGLLVVVAAIAAEAKKAAGLIVDIATDPKVLERAEKEAERKKRERRRQAVIRKRDRERRKEQQLAQDSLTRGFTGPQNFREIDDNETFRAMDETTAGMDSPLSNLANEDIAIAARENIAKVREEIDDLTLSFDAFGGTLENEWAERLRGTAIIVEEEIGRVSSIFAKAQEAGIGSGEAVAKAAPGMIKAFGNIAGALGASIEIQETLYGLADVAQSATQFASQNYLGGAMFAVSAGLHFAAAGAAASKGKGGGGRGAGGGRAPQANIAPPPEAARGPVTINQNFGGAAFVGPGGVREASRALTGMVDSEHSSGSHSADFAAAG